MTGLEPLQWERREEFKDLVNGCEWEGDALVQFLPCLVQPLPEVNPIVIDIGQKQ